MMEIPHSPPTPGWAFSIRDQIFDLSTPQLIGILNVTPDSFSDGGNYNNETAALKRVEHYLDQGVVLIDVGAESTRPGFEPISASEELTRLIPFIEAIRKRFPEAILSVDTYHLETMRTAVLAGADWINDIRALEHDEGALEAVARLNVPVILMHSKKEAEYSNVVSEVVTYLKKRKDEAIFAGIHSHKIVVDPGFGFGKLKNHNWSLLQNLSQLSVLQAPILVGLSRKSMFAHLVEGPAERRAQVGSAAAFYAALQGAHFIRTHDVSVVKSFLLLWSDLMAVF